MNIGKEIEKYEKDIVKDICELIAIKSVKSEPLPGKPFGAGIAVALDYMLRKGEELGFRSKNIGGYAGHVEYGEGEEIIAVLVHLDTVAAGEGWSTNPFEGVIHGDLITGRGASDNKGPAVVALYALAALRDAVVNPHRRIRIIFGTDEESGMSDMDKYFEQEPLPLYSFTPDASYPIIHAEKGYLVITLEQMCSVKQETNDVSHQRQTIVEVKGGEAPNVVPDQCAAKLDLSSMDATVLSELLRLAEQNNQVTVEVNEQQAIVRMKGKTGHGSYPPSGVNAIAKLLKLLHHVGLLPPDSFLRFLNERIGEEAFGQSLGIACEHPTYGKLTVNLASMHVHEGKETAVLNVRYPVTEDGGRLLQQLSKKLENWQIRMRVDHHLPPLYVSEDAPLIRKLSEAYESVMGEPAKLLSIGGGTYARKLRGTGVAFGAGFPGRQHGPGPHQPNECVSISDLLQHGQICTQALYMLQQT